MYATLGKELKVIVKLAKEREKLIDTNQDSSLDNIKNLLSGNLDNSPERAAKKRLSEYLKTLSFTKIKALQTIMYVGRDTINEDLTPDELYNEKYAELSWQDDKYIEIRQMVDKAPLGDYLERGAKLLKISI